jgi:hypothetical protein
MTGTIDRKPFEINMEGLDRSGSALPEKAKDFFDFFAKVLAERYLYRPLDDRMMQAVKSEGLQLLSVANEVYQLGVGPDFWEVNVVKDETYGRVTIDPRPRVLHGRSIVMTECEDNSVIASWGDPETATHLVRGDSFLEALTALGRIIERRDAYR